MATSHASGQDRATFPPANPFLIQNNSVYPSAHFALAQTDTTSLPVWLGETTIAPSQVQWLPGLTTIGTVDRPYENGEQATLGEAMSTRLSKSSSPSTCATASRLTNEKRRVASSVVP